MCRFCFLSTPHSILSTIVVNSDHFQSGAITNIATRTFSSKKLYSFPFPLGNNGCQCQPGQGSVLCLGNSRPCGLHCQEPQAASGPQPVLLLMVSVYVWASDDHSKEAPSAGTSSIPLSRPWGELLHHLNSPSLGGFNEDNNNNNSNNNNRRFIYSKVPWTQLGYCFCVLRFPASS